MWVGKDFRIRLLFDTYARFYSWSAREYAENTIPLWMNGSKRMSGQTAARIFDLMPRILNTNERIEILEPILNNYKEFNRKRYFNFNFEDVNSDLDKINDIFFEERNKILQMSADLPEDLVKAVRWLCEDDIVVARQLIHDSNKNKNMLIIENAKHSIDMLINALSNENTKKIYQEIELPNSIIQVNYEKKSNGIFARALRTLFN